MANIMKDKYILAQSIDKNLSKTGDELRLDLKLNEELNDINGLKIYGNIKDENNNPIVNATIKLMSADYHPIAHTKTNLSGNYFIYNLQENLTYNIFAIASGYILEQNNISSFFSGGDVKIDFVLKKDPNSNISAISGTVRDSITKSYKANIIVKLINITNNSEVLEAVTYTNNNGSFIFTEVPLGDYLVNITNIAYNTLNINVSLINAGQIVSLIASITPKANLYTGIISGYISDCSKNAFIVGADVILYEVNNDNSLNPIAFTKTIENGFYMFGNLPRGEYKIKSNYLKQTTLSFPNPWNYSPYFYSFMISSSDGKFNQTYYAKDAVIYGAATVENDFIENVGSLLGYLILPNITVPTKGEYQFKITYVADDDVRVCNISVNNLSTEELYAFTKTKSLLISDANIKTISLNLIAGTNVIKIYNE